MPYILDKGLNLIAATVTQTPSTKSHTFSIGRLGNDSIYDIQDISSELSDTSSKHFINVMTYSRCHPKQHCAWSLFATFKYTRISPMSHVIDLLRVFCCQYTVSKKSDFKPVRNGYINIRKCATLTLGEIGNLMYCIMRVVSI